MSTSADLIAWPDEPSSEVQPDDELPLCCANGTDWAIIGGYQGDIKVRGSGGGEWWVPSRWLVPLTPFAADLLAALVADDA